MKIKVVLGLILLFIVKTSCTSNHRIEKYDLSPITENSIGNVNETDSLSKLDLCSVIPFDWDSLVVLPPYAHKGMLKQLNLTNINEIAEQFPYSTANRLPLLTVDERACVLLFISGNRIVNYSQVMRAALDFKDLVKENELIRSISREDFCNQLYLVKRNDTLTSASAYKIDIDKN